MHVPEMENAHTYINTRIHTHAHTHTRTRAHTHTHSHAQLVSTPTTRRSNSSSSSKKAKRVVDQERRRMRGREVSSRQKTSAGRRSRALSRQPRSHEAAAGVYVWDVWGWGCKRWPLGKFSAPASPGLGPLPNEKSAGAPCAYVWLCLG
jgi:hypothetical protein